MTSADSNLFVYAADPDSPRHAASRGFFESTRNLPGGFALCELVLVEVYMLLRNPAIFAKPYSHLRHLGLRPSQLPLLRQRNAPPQARPEL